MKAIGTNAWVSYHFYHSKHPDGLLAESIWPLVQRLRSEHLIRQFFFIRYGDERGPHIRLRLLPSRTIHRQEVMRQTRAHFPDAEFVTYVPEIERYGGHAGMAIAENLFEASSVATIRLITGDVSWSYSRALASAMQMHIGMLQAFGLTRQETAALCAHLVQSTQNKSLAKPSADHFERSFAAQRRAVVPHLLHVWDACEQHMDFNVPWFTDWQKAMHQIGVRIRQADKAGKLTLTDTPRHDSPLWCLYESYIHMSNNRLGITPQDESFLAYMLHQSLKERQKTL